MCSRWSFKEDAIGIHAFEKLMTPTEQKRTFEDADRETGVLFTSEWERGISASTV